MNYILFDLEATCWKNPPLHYTQEIIEIAAIAVNRFGEIESSFTSYVKPVQHGLLSMYCTDLTGITQVQVERARTFKSVAVEFVDWAGLDESESMLCSWGAVDLQLLQQDCHYHQIDSTFLKHFVDLKKQYAEIRKVDFKTLGLSKALAKEGLEFEGRKHRAMDDVLNLHKIFNRYIDEWYF